ncbi:MAG: beta strand repeat-containing protein, partial [Terrimicrobiaceae bacterium]
MITPTNRFKKIPMGFRAFFHRRTPCGHCDVMVRGLWNALPLKRFPLGKTFARSIFSFHLSAFSFFFSLLLAAPAARAATVTWSGASPWGVWGNGTNWVGGAVPATTDTATFSNTNSNQAVMIGAAQTIAGLVFNNTGTTVLESGGGTTNSGISLGAGGITVNAGAGAVLIGYNVSPLRMSVTLSASQVWTNDSSYTLTEDGSSGVNLGANTLTISGTGNTRINPVISGTGSLIKTGAGILSLNGASTYSGTTTISGGTLQIGTGSSTGALSASSAISNNGTLVINRSIATTQGGNFSSAGITGTGNFTQAGIGTTTLTANNTYTGATTVSAGILQLNRNTGSLSSSSALTFSGNGGTFNMDNTGAAGALSQSLGNLTFSAGEGVVKTTNTAIQNQAITFSTLATRAAGAVGNFVNGGGTNGIANGFVITAQGAGFIDQGTFFGGGTSNATYAYMDAAGTYVRGLNYGTDSNTSNVTVTAATIGNPGSAYNVQVGNVAITGQTTTQISTLQLGTSAFTLASGATLTVNGILKAGNTNGNTINGTAGSGIQAANNSELVIRTDQTSDTLTISTPILDNGSSSLTKSGAGTLTLSGNNTYTGTTTVLAGTLAYGASNALSSGNVTVTGGVLSLGSFSDTVGAVTVTGQGSITGSTGVLTGTSYSLYTNYATDTANGITISAI